MTCFLNLVLLPKCTSCKCIQFLIDYICYSLSYTVIKYEQFILRNIKNKIEILSHSKLLGRPKVFQSWAAEHQRWWWWWLHKHVCICMKYEVYMVSDFWSALMSLQVIILQSILCFSGILLMFNKIIVLIIGWYFLRYKDMQNVLRTTNKSGFYTTCILYTQLLYNLILMLLA